MSKMAPECLCGHKASEHSRVVRIRTLCTMVEVKHGVIPKPCPCTIYRPKET